MSELQPKLNSKITSTVLKVGREKTPVVIIDNFIEDLSSLVDYICNHVSFDVEKHTYYPGYRSEIVDGYKHFIADVIGSRLFEPFSIPRSHKLVIDASYYSLVATPPSELIPAQCRPHSDTSLPHYLAVMHYLSPGVHGGTGFFRHIPTNFEKISADRLNRYLDCIAEWEKSNGVPKKQYITESSDQFELIGEVGYKPNRVIIYPGCLLHSGLINPSTDICSDPINGRLTANVFLNFIPG